MQVLFRRHLTPRDTLIALCAILFGISPARAQSSAPELPTPTEVHVVSSAISDRDYTLSVYLPDGYATSQDVLPVLYALDGDTRFDDLAAYAREQIESRDLIVVGVGFGESLPERRSSRFQAYVPMAVPDLPGSGGADRFLGALEADVIPWIETSFRADSTRRILAGHSLGGFFALHALLTRPVLFHQYIAISPSLAIDAFEDERADFALPEDIQRDLALVVGAAENPTGMIEPFDAFVSALESKPYPGLTVTTHKIEGANHRSVVLPALEKTVKAISMPPG